MTMEFVQTSQGDVIKDTDTGLFCFLSVMIAAYSQVQYWPTLGRCVDAGVVDGTKAEAFDGKHLKMVLMLDLPKAVRSKLDGAEATARPGRAVYSHMVGLSHLKLWHKFTRRGARRALAALIEELDVDPVANLRPAAQDVGRPVSATWSTEFMSRYETSAYTLSRIVAPRIVQHKLVAGATMVGVLDGLKQTANGYPSPERMLDVWGHIDAVARVGNGLVGLSYKYATGSKEVTALSLSVDDGVKYEGDAYLADSGERLLANYLVSAVGSPAGNDSKSVDAPEVSAICVVKRWIVGDILSATIRALRVDGRTLQDLPQQASVVVGGCVLYRSTGKKVVVYIPWSLFVAYGDASTVVHRSRARRARRETQGSVMVA